MATIHQSRLSGAVIRRLMRRHHVTIKSLAGQFKLTQKRVREVRLNGVTGFLASEWHYMITGAWLDASISEQAEKGTCA